MKKLFLCLAFFTGLAAHPQVAVTYIADSVLSCPPSVVNVPISVLDFNDILSFSIKLNYKYTYLSYQGASINPALNSFIVVPNNAILDTNGHAAFMLAGFAFNPLSLPDSTILCTLTFNYLSGSSDLEWDTTGTMGGSLFRNGYVGPLMSLSGNISYMNSQSSPLPSTSLSFLNGLQTVFSLTTNQQGNLAMSPYLPGTYTLGVSTALPWGGANAVDGLMALQHFTGMITLGGMAAQAADVNADGSINSIDALMILQRYVGIIQSFPAGDWIWNLQGTTLPACGQSILMMKGICTGDINGSYLP